MTANNAAVAAMRVLVAMFVLHRASARVMCRDVREGRLLNGAHDAPKDVPEIIKTFAIRAGGRRGRQTDTERLTTAHAGRHTKMPINLPRIHLLRRF